MTSGVCLTTDRLQLRDPIEADRKRFLELFGNASFMAFSSGACHGARANERFDRMLADAAAVPFSKRPIVELATGRVLGYSGVARFKYEGEDRLEYGYRLCDDARGKGYATEAGLAMIDAARDHFSGTILAMVDPTNHASINVITKIGFTFWKLAEIDGYLDNFYRIEL